MHLSFLLTISIVVCHLAVAIPQHGIGELQSSAELEHSKGDIKLLKFIHKLLHTLQDDYQDPNWPTNLQSKSQPTLDEDCGEEETQIFEDECDDDNDYAIKNKNLERVNAHGGSFDDPDHVCGKVCFCDSHEQSKPAAKLEQAISKSSVPSRNEKVYEDVSSEVAISFENNKPKHITNSYKNTHAVTPQTPSKENRILQELIHKRFSDLHLPRIQINQFGTNKVEQNLYHQLMGHDYMSKNQGKEMQSKIAGYAEINCVRPHTFGSDKFSTHHDTDKGHDRSDHAVSYTKKINSKQDSSEQNEYHRHESGPILTATQSSIQHSDVDITFGGNKNTQINLNEQPTQFKVTKLQTKKTDLAEVSNQHDSLHLRKVYDQPTVSNQHKVLVLPEVTEQPKVPDQPIVIIDDITEDTTTGHPKYYGFTTEEDLLTQTNLMAKGTTGAENTTIPALGEATTDTRQKDNAEDVAAERSKITENTASNESRRNKAVAVTPTIGTLNDQEAGGSQYYTLSSNEGGYDHQLLRSIYPESRHGVPIAYESNPRASASQFYANYYNPGIKIPSPRIPTNSPSSLFRTSKDRFAIIQPDIDYDDYGDYEAQISYPAQYRSLSTPAASPYRNSFYKPWYGKSIRRSPDSLHTYAKHPRFAESQSIFEHDDFDNPELTAGWEDWEPSYINDMLYEKSYLRPAIRALHGYHQY